MCTLAYKIASKVSIEFFISWYIRAWEIKTCKCPYMKKKKKNLIISLKVNIHWCAYLGKNNYCPNTQFYLITGKLDRIALLITNPPQLVQQFCPQNKNDNRSLVTRGGGVRWEGEHPILEEFCHRNAPPNHEKKKTLGGFKMIQVKL